MTWKNKLFYGDNLPILREHIQSESVDLIYLDPPFNSNRNYNVLFRDESGQEAEAQITAFEDTWHWDQAAAETYHELVTEAAPHISSMIGALRGFIGTNQMMAYLVMMAARLVELHRVLKPTGSLYLHCDPTASHYLKIILDTVFGAENFLNEVTWKRTSGHSDARRKFAEASDVLFLYSKSSDYKFNVQYMPYSDEYIKSHYRSVDADGRRYTTRDLRSPSPRPNLTYEYKGYKPHPNGWSISREKMERLDQQGLLYFPRSKGGRIRLKRYLDEMPGTPVTDVWDDIAPINSQAAERLGYPTQKPLELLERIIKASSNEGDIVLDPFCGCGTAVAAAQKLNRRWLGIDITHLAVALIRYRIEEMFPGAEFEVIGEPESLGAAEYLASYDPYQFQWWALSLVRARPLGGQQGSKKGKKGADRGIDGVITFIDDATEKPKQVLVQVKSGKVSSRDMRDLNGTIRREKAAIGVFITLQAPTRDMRQEAASAGFYESPGWGKKYPRLQILTIEELLNGAEVQMPPPYGTFKQAQRVEKDPDAQQGRLDL